ncbi:MAG: hypothetical protein RL020_532 [Pseudomonadota bacterium]
MLTGGLDEFFTRTTSGATPTTRHMLPDALGSVIGLTDDTGALVKQYSYEPYGETASTGEANDSSYQYTGRENDGTGLYYYRARYYHPQMKRFISEDPLGVAGGVNLYQYVGGMPTMFTDPTGLDWFRQPGAPYYAGRDGSIVEPGPNGNGRVVDDSVPAGHTFAQMHDNLVDADTAVGLPDWLANIPTMIPVYVTAVIKEINRSIAETVSDIIRPSPGCK